MAGADPVATVEREGALLRLQGPLDRSCVPALWPRLLPLADGAEVLDVHGVCAIDSAGLALLAELASRLAARGTLRVEGDPPGLSGLRAAYRMSPDLLRMDSSA